jgi:hypothetical protein
MADKVPLTEFQAHLEGAFCIIEDLATNEKIIVNWPAASIDLSSVDMFALKELFINYRSSYEDQRGSS